MVFVLAIVLIQRSFSRQRYYTNPIHAGFYPDPGIYRVGDNYYLINSSFAYFPGLPVFHSKGLVNWKQIGSATPNPPEYPGKRRNKKKKFNMLSFITTFA